VGSHVIVVVAGLGVVVDPNSNAAGERIVATMFDAIFERVESRAASCFDGIIQNCIHESADFLCILR
jgi:hypothetical protein